MIKHVIFNLLAAAVILRDRIANRLGYPKNGSDVGGGIHVSSEDSKTLYYTGFRKHPVQSKWALLVDDVARPHLRAGTDTEEDLTNDWDEPRTKV